MKHFIIIISVLLNISFISASDYKNSPKEKFVKSITTRFDRSKYLERKETRKKRERKDNNKNQISVERGSRFQQIDGFGAAITGSTCFNLLHMKEDERSKFLRDTFDPNNGYGFSYVRIAIGCSDFSLSELTCCDEPGIENFKLQNEDINYIIPILREILIINPEIKIIGSPWTAPRWMKVKNLQTKETYNSWTGGHLNPEYYNEDRKSVV